MADGPHVDWTQIAFGGTSLATLIGLSLKAIVGLRETARKERIAAMAANDLRVDALEARVAEMNNKTIADLRQRCADLEEALDKQAQRHDLQIKTRDDKILELEKKVAALEAQDRIKQSELDRIIKRKIGSP